MKDESRRAIGFIGIIIGIFCIIEMIQNNSSGSRIYNAIDLFAIPILLGWMALSSSVKLMMATGKKAIWLNTTSLALFLVMVLLACLSKAIYGSSDSGTEYKYSTEVIYFMFLFGWPTIDALDLMFD
jgi:hypothetical protein